MFEGWIEFRYKGKSLYQIGYDNCPSQKAQSVVARIWRGAGPFDCNKMQDYYPYYEWAEKVANRLKQTKQHRIVVRTCGDGLQARPLVKSIEIVYHRPRTHTVRWE